MHVPRQYKETLGVSTGCKRDRKKQLCNIKSTLKVHSTYIVISKFNNIYCRVTEKWSTDFGDYFDKFNDGEIGLII